MFTTSFPVNKDLCFTSVQPEITAKAAANAVTGFLDFKIFSAPSVKRSINSSGTVSSDL